jgi:hypothetical protein
MSSSTKWAGCVESRDVSVEIADTAPSTGTPSTLWVPYFQPDEPDSGYYYTDDYLSDGTVTNSSGRSIKSPTDLQRQNNSNKYSGKSANSYVNEYCDMPAIVPLTNNMTTIKSTLNAMGANGGTHIPLGAAWGWRVLSPTAPYTEGAQYDDGKTQKVMILMTDGENTVSSQSTMNGSMYSAFGYLSQGRLGTTSSTSKAEQKLDSMLTDICTNMKEKKIRIYTIGFQISSNNVLNLLKACATDTSMFYNSPSTASLQTAFASIATDLSNLRLSK